MSDLITRLYESDEANALTNEAARNIESLCEALEDLLSELDVMAVIATRAGNPEFFAGLAPELSKADAALARARNEGGGG